MDGKVDPRLLLAAALSAASLYPAAGAPLLIGPALLLALWSFILHSSREVSKFYNIIDKNSKKTLAAVVLVPPNPVGGGSAREGDVHVSGACSATYSSTLVPVACLPASWESSTLMYNIVGDSDVVDRNMTSTTTWMGIGDSEGYALRCDNDEPRGCKFIRIGRLSPSSSKSPFASDISDPHLEPIALATDVNADKRKASALDSSGITDDKIRCGDIVMLVDQNRKTLSNNGWWLIFSRDAVSTNCYFVITVLSDDGTVKHGTALTAGMSFRLRSAKYPKYEVGCQASSSIENKGNLLVMYEFSKYPARSYVRWKQGGQVNPLFLCMLPEQAKTSLPPTVAAQRKSKWNVYGGLVSTFSVLRRFPVRNVRAVGHVEMMHRLLNKVFLVVIVAVSGSDEYGDKEWMCLRSATDVDRVLASAEAQQDTVLQSRGYPRGNNKNHRPLEHESAIGQDLRLMNHRFQAALKQDPKARGVARALFTAVFRHAGLWDCWFLGGSAKDLGVTAAGLDKALGAPVLTVSVARMLWESYVREEVCVLYSSQLVFFAPQTSKPSWSLPLRDVVGLADVHLEESPLPGTFTLRIETMGRVYYLSCNSFDVRRVLRDAIAVQISGLALPVQRVSPTSSLMGGASPDTFTHVSGQWLPSTRLILNARRFAFDSQSRSCRTRWLKDESYWRLSEHLLQAASDVASLHLERSKGGGSLLGSSGDASSPGRLGGISNSISNSNSIGNGRSVGSGGGGASDGGSAHADDDEERLLKSKLLSFLDEVSCLRLVNLATIDLASKEALCFFSNVYHALLLHARTVLRLPSKSDWGLFFSSVSYCVGDDVFSLAELEQCVLRGKLSRPKVTSRHDPAVLSLGDSHFHYALEKADCRINFLINSGSVSNPDCIYMLMPWNLEAQLAAASRNTLVHSISIDFGYNTVTLPKLCEVYKADLGGDNTSAVLKQCLSYIEKTQLGQDLEALLKEAVPAIKYLLMTYESRSRLTLHK